MIANKIGGDAQSVSGDNWSHLAKSQNRDTRNFRIARVAIYLKFVLELEAVLEVVQGCKLPQL